MNCKHDWLLYDTTDIVWGCSRRALTGTGRHCGFSLPYHGKKKLPEGYYLTKDGTLRKTAP